MSPSPIAISNRRLLALDDLGEMGNSRITFAYRTSGTGENKTMTLPAEAFLQRFLQHILPKGFVKVRYYGYFAPGCRHRLEPIRRQLTPQEVASGLSQTATPGQNLSGDLECPPENRPLCLQCGQSMPFFQVLPRQLDRAPP